MSRIVEVEDGRKQSVEDASEEGCAYVDFGVVGREKCVLSRALDVVDRVSAVPAADAVIVARTLRVDQVGSALAGMVECSQETSATRSLVIVLGGHVDVLDMGREQDFREGPVACAGSDAVMAAAVAAVNMQACVDFGFASVFL